MPRITRTTFINLDDNPNNITWTTTSDSNADVRCSSDQIVTSVVTSEGINTDIIDRVCPDEKMKQLEEKIKQKCCICGGKASFCNVSGLYYCNDCLEKFFSKCERCGAYYDKKNIFEVSNRHICYNCLCYERYGFCKSCKTWKKRFVHVNGDGIYCEKCLKNTDCFKCDECGGVYHRDRFGKNNICINCTNSRLTEVRNYSYKPEPRFFKKANVSEEDLYFGVELEMGNVDSPDIVNDFVAEYSNSFFYMKKDTSIPVYGCEIVTQPATLSKHIDSRYWKTMLSVAKDYGFDADNDTCGIHIHISRDYFTNYDIAKLDCFVNTYDIFKKIARRESHYSQYLKKDFKDWGSQISNRKCALNLSNESTVEMRIFKGTIEYKYVMAYIEFCHAISTFIKAISMDEIIQNKTTTLVKFRKLIECGKYKFIDDYCKKFKIFE